MYGEKSGRRSIRLQADHLEWEGRQLKHAIMLVKNEFMRPGVLYYSNLYSASQGDRPGIRILPVLPIPVY